MSETSAKKQWFQTALREHQGPLIRFTKRITWNEEEAMDVVQESFLKLWNQPYPEAISWIPPWLFRVCRNHALDLKRKNKNREFWDDETNLPTTLLGPEESLQNRQELKALATLKMQSQEVLFLKFAEGLSYQEIAEVTGLSASHVGVLIHQAMKTLRTMKKEDDNE